MKVKIPNTLLLINFLSVALVLVVNLMPSSFLRVVLGLPYLLYFPGYVLIAALFHKGGIDGIERVALSFGMSIAVVPLIGLGLNYTSWGITLDSVLYSVAAFIFVVSVVAMKRQKLIKTEKLLREVMVKFPGWEGGRLDKALSLLLAVSILAAVGVLAYTVAFPKVGEKFTEFDIIGLKGQAANYPAEFTLDKGQVASVRYGEGRDTPARWGNVTLGIINQEQEMASYLVTVTIDGQPVDVSVNGNAVGKVGPVNLAQGEKWEGQIGIAPGQTGDAQKIEFWLYKGVGAEPYRTLRLWIDVK